MTSGGPRPSRSPQQSTFYLGLLSSETDPIQKVLHYPSNDELIYLNNSTITAKTANLDQDKVPRLEWIVLSEKWKILILMEKNQVLDTLLPGEA
uniref:Uncharacterized protein n=1 Tax=Magallana gigas TaxID=29159 RepID=K1PTB3_MAGGI